MKNAIVPAQITSVEDKLAGNLTLNQLLLLTAPIFIDIGIYTILPKELQLNSYKLLFMFFSNCLLCVAAIRVKNRLVIGWLILLVRYNLRPRYFVFNKNDEFQRLKTETVTEINKPKEGPNYLKSKPKLIAKGLSVSYEEQIRLNSLLANPKISLGFMLQKNGGLRVFIKQIK